MTRDVHDVMAQFDGGTVVRELDSRSTHAVYEVRTDRRRAVCKTAGGDPEAVVLDAALLGLVGEETPIPVPAVFAAGTDHYLAAWVDGEAYDGDAPDAVREHRLFDAGATMARLHEACRFEAHGRFGVDDAVPLDPVGAWDEMLLDVARGWREDLPGRFVHLGDAVVSFLANHRAAFVDRPATLVHGDYGGDNLLFDGAAVAAVLDWELAFAGAGAFDLARTEQVLFGGDRPAEPDDGLRSALREGYESVRPLPAGSEGRRAAYRAVLALNPLRYFREWADDAGDPEDWAAYFEAFVPGRLAVAREGLEVAP